MYWGCRSRAYGPEVGEPVRALRFVEMLPRHGEQPESRADQHEAQQMERPEMGIRLPAEHHLEQVPGVV